MQELVAGVLERPGHELHVVRIVFDDEALLMPFSPLRFNSETETAASAYPASGKCHSPRVFWVHLMNVAWYSSPRTTRSPTRGSCRVYAHVLER